MLFLRGVPLLPGGSGMSRTVVLLGGGHVNCLVLEAFHKSLKARKDAANLRIVLISEYGQYVITLSSSDSSLSDCMTFW